jgi:hypothetical protein
MRLLRVDDASLVERQNGKIPEYAILSHTWSLNEEEEYTFEDAQMNTGTNKSGYCKVQFCIRQAKEDGLGYVWIDSCCIDRKSSAELTEAINSMFKWYQGASKCYVYLTDVSSKSESTSEANRQRQCSWNSTIKESRWFTRCWTLQELLAPKHVEFFSREGVSLGQKEGLRTEINKITRIPIEILQNTGRSMLDCSVEERYGWAKGRKAKRDEDHVYSLLGLFDIHMPLLYGEGRAKAFARLEREIALQQWLQEAPSQRLGFSSRHSSSLGNGGTNQNMSRRSSDLHSGLGSPDDRSRSESGRQTHGKSSEIKDDYGPPNSSFTYTTTGTQFIAYGGTQINNTGSGNQFSGDFHGSVHFA